MEHCCCGNQVNSQVSHVHGDEILLMDLDVSRLLLLSCLCERSAGTGFQLPNPDAIYSRDEGKERRWLPSHVVCVRARSTHC
jgi:hypothetical protein